MKNPSLEMMQEEFETALKTHLHLSIPEAYTGLLPMMTYHLGWSGEGAGHVAQGKRVRPTLVLLSCLACGEDWKAALPAALAVELVHNFSLIHDDIQDNSSLRRGRPTVWKKWGIAQAINTGDLMFNLAFAGIRDLEKQLPPKLVLEACQILTQACTLLTGGQYLDLSYEQVPEITEEAYWSMIKGKTAALISCSAELGALCAGVSTSVRHCFALYGENLGCAFQVWDDWLGIWGNPAITGKAAGSDLMAGKKSLPILFGIAQKGEFARLWRHGTVTPDTIGRLTAALEEEGAKDYTEATAIRLTSEAKDALDQIVLAGCEGHFLREYSESLVNRPY